MKHPISIRIIHWTHGMLLIGLLAVGWFMTPFDSSKLELSKTLYFMHKSFGIVAIMFVLVRLINRIFYSTHPLPQDLKWYERIGAKSVQTLLYILMIAVPVLGYIQSSAYQYSGGIPLFFINLPRLVPVNQEIFELANMWHRYLAYTMVACVALHICGALKHRLFDKPQNDVLGKML